MPSFDTVCEPNLVEVRNAVDNAAKEIGTRFDFKGTSAALEIKDKEITLFGDADFQLTQVEDILTAKLAKRNVDVRFLDKGKVEKIGGDKVKQVVKVRSGIESEHAKRVQKLIKESKLKVQAAIQGDAVRVTAPSGTTCRPRWRSSARRSPTCPFPSTTSGIDGPPEAASGRLPPGGATSGPAKPGSAVALESAARPCAVCTLVSCSFGPGPVGGAAGHAGRQGAADRRRRTAEDGRGGRQPQGRQGAVHQR